MMASIRRRASPLVVYRSTWTILQGRPRRVVLAPLEPFPLCSLRLRAGSRAMPVYTLPVVTL